MTTYKFSDEQSLIHSYIIKITKTSDSYISLFYGILGGAIIFYEYGRLMDNKAYTRYADHLLDKVWSNIHKRTPLSLDAGLFGIGWGLEYLLQNNFVAGVGAEICEDINQKIIQLDPRRITDYSLETGILGLMHYLLIHIKGCKYQNSPLAFDKIYLTEVAERVNHLFVKRGDNQVSEVVNLYNDFISNNILEYSPSINLWCNKGEEGKKDKSIGLAQNELIKKIF